MNIDMIVSKLWNVIELCVAATLHPNGPLMMHAVHYDAAVGIAHVSAH